MSMRIKQVLMICSSYDAYILEEDGQIEAQMQREYADLNLSNPPAFTWVTSVQQALKLLQDGRTFDLIICMLNIGEDHLFTFAEQLRKTDPVTPIVLLTNYSREFQKRLDKLDRTAINYVFCWNGNADLILAIIKLIEDQMNARQDVLELGVQSILLVEDSVRYYSTYLPAVYKLLLTQSANFLKETLSERQQKFRKRARPKLFLATNYQEAEDMYNRYKDNLLGVISDVGFVLHKDDPMESEKLDAGLDLCRMIKNDNPQMPIILQSSQESIRQVAQQMGVGFVLKHSKTLLLELSEYFADEFAFGDFVVRDLETGEVLSRAADLEQLQALMRVVPERELLHHTSRNRLSKWLYSRGLFTLANRIKQASVTDFENTAQVRTYIIELIKDFRILNAQGVIARFDPQTYHKYIPFARLGDGSLGGKARGLAFLNKLLLQYGLGTQFPGLRISIPRTVVVASDYFDLFIVENGLQYVVNAEGISDQEILSEFVSSRLPQEMSLQLRTFIEYVTAPLAVRSSSKLEDSLFQPFAGVYATYMIPLTQNKDQMFRLLSKAIKSVYASVFYAASRNYIQSTANMLSEEKMAIVIQDVCGTLDGELFFPTFSGVARSIDYYPLGHQKAEDGTVSLAFGLGKWVVEGGKTLRFSPKYPRHVIQTSTVKSTLAQTQNQFYALSMQPERFKTSLDDGVNLVKIPVAEASGFRNLKYVASTWDMANERITPGVHGAGRKLITFENILKYDALPLAPALAHLLEICSREMRSHVEMEFAVNCDVPPGAPAQFYLLQVRPITDYGRSVAWDPAWREQGECLLEGTQALGPGLISGIQDIVYVRLDRFDSAHTREMAQEVEQLNAQCKAQGRHYVLVGTGRWGSSDPWLGIPIYWSHISQARLIVECGLPQFQVDPSQGTHFFQNLTSLGVGYLTINPFRGDGLFRQDLLDALPAWYESHYLRAVRLPAELLVFSCGREGRGLVMMQ